MENHFAELCDLIDSAIVYVAKDSSEKSKKLCKNLQDWKCILAVVITQEDIEKFEFLKKLNSKYEEKKFTMS